MPRSLSGRCHTEHPLWKPFRSLQLCDEAALQMPTAFHWRSLRRHQLLKLRSMSSQRTRHPSLAMEEKGEGVTCRRPQEPQNQRTRNKNEGNQIPDTGGLDILLMVRQHRSWWQWSRTPHLLLPLWTKSVSCGTLLGETHSIFIHQWVIEPQQRRNLKCRMKQSHFERMRLRRSAYTFIAMNIACFDLIQLRCLPTGKGLNFSGHENKSKTSERRKQKEKLTNDQCIFTGSQSFVRGLVYVRWRI